MNVSSDDRRGLTGESALGAAVGAVAMGIVGAVLGYYVHQMDIHLPGISPALAAEGWALMALGVLAVGALGGLLGAILGDLGPHIRIDWAFPRSEPLTAAAAGLLLGALGGAAGAGLATGLGLAAGRDVGLDWRGASSVLLGADVLTSEGASGREILAGVGAYLAAAAWWGLLLGLAIGFFRRRLARSEAVVLAMAAALLSAAVDYYLALAWLQPALVQLEPFWTLALPRLVGAVVFVAFPRLRRGASPRTAEAPPANLLG